MPILRAPLALAASAALALAGCSPDPRETRGHLEPGNSIVVAQEALGQATSGGGYNDGATIGVVPFVDYRQPNVPVMQDGVVDYLFVFSSESLDGEAERDEHWVKVKVQEQSFTKGHKNDQKSLLNDAQPVARTNMVPASARLRSPERDGDTTIMPRVRPLGTPQTRVTVAEVDGTGEPRVIGTQSIPKPAAGTDQPPSNPDVQRMLDSFNALQQSREATPGQLPTSGTVSPVPQPGAAGTTSTPVRH